ncbi:MAG: hypothetical protein HC845_02965 [Akkermansiaceae bacterium]|nr:hypothetical protein [Akkermansiaceae bacterium]
MSSDPITPPNGNPILAKSRPNLENLAKDTTESDLWALDDLELKPPGRAGFRTGSNLPTLRPEEKPETPENAKPPTPEKNAAEKFHTPGPPAKAAFLERSVPMDDMLDLGVLQGAEELDDSQPGVITTPAPQQQTEATKEPVEAAAKNEKASTLVTKNLQDELKESQKGNIKNVPRKRKIFSPMEWLGLATVFLLLAGLGTFAFMKSIAQLETSSIYDSDLKFPIKGERLNVTTATSYWRAPNTNGASNESVRDGTVLIPVLELTSSTGPAALRVVYRDEEGKIIGDILNRPIASGEKITIPATAGFNNHGQHAAYRAGQAKRWMIEILEAASEKPLPQSSKSSLNSLFLANSVKLNFSYA